MKVPQGATEAYKFIRRDGDGEVITTAAAEIIFTVRETASESSEAVITKSLGDGDIIFSEEDYYYRFIIEPEDTEGLTMGKTYRYSIWVYADSGSEVRTPIKRNGDFIVQTVVPANEEGSE